MSGLRAADVDTQDAASTHRQQKRSSNQHRLATLAHPTRLRASRRGRGLIGEDAAVTLAFILTPQGGIRVTQSGAAKAGIHATSIPAFFGKIPGKSGLAPKSIRPVRDGRIIAPMSIATNPLNIDHRLTRLLTVVWLRLLRMFAKLIIAEAPYREDLNAMSRFVASFILIRACQRLDPDPRPAPPERPANAPPGFHQRKPAKSFGFVRTAVGSKLRRRLRGRTAFAHIAALIRAILNLDALTAQLVKRMKRRLTRLRPLVLAYAISAALPALRAPTAFAADTS